MKPIQITMAKDLARAITQMDDIAFSEGQGPETDAEYDAWDKLLHEAEKIAGREADSTNHRLYHESLKDAN